MFLAPVNFLRFSMLSTRWKQIYIRALPALINEDSLKVGNGMQTEAIMVINDVLAQANRERNSCENQENKCCDELNILTPEVSTIVRCSGGKAQNYCTDVHPFQIRVNSAYMTGSENPL